MPKIIGSLRTGIHPRNHGACRIEVYVDGKVTMIRECSTEQFERIRRDEQVLAKMSPAEKLALIAQLEAE